MPLGLLVIEEVTVPDRVAVSVPDPDCVTVTVCDPVPVGDAPRDRVAVGVPDMDAVAVTEMLCVGVPV